MNAVPKKQSITTGFKLVLASGALVALLAACTSAPATDADSGTTVPGRSDAPAVIATVHLKDGQTAAEALATLGGSQIQTLSGSSLSPMSAGAGNVVFLALDEKPLGTMAAGAFADVVFEDNIDRFISSATLETLKDSTIWAENADGAIRANGDSTIWAEGDSTIWAEGDSTIWAEGDSTIWAEGDSTIWAEKDSTIWAEGGIRYRWMPPNTKAWQLIGLRDAHREVDNHGLGIVIAVIDTGVDSAHPWLQSQLAVDGKDFVDNDDDPSEEGSPADASFGHGTSVAGIIRQIAPRATIMPLRVLEPDGSGDVLQVVQAVYHAVEFGADIINLSLGGPSPSHALNTALDYAADQGVLIVTTAGNEGRKQINHPGHHAWTNDNIISVTSVDKDGFKSSFANHHERVEISAPGELIYGPYPGERMAAWSGTSMAAPVVAGSLALALAERLDDDYTNNHGELVEEFFEESSNVYFGSNNQYRNPGRQLGAGIIDVEEFLDEVLR